jgi:hypothetical protein
MAEQAPHPESQQNLHSAETLEIFSRLIQDLKEQKTQLAAVSRPNDPAFNARVDVLVERVDYTHTLVANPRNQEVIDPKKVREFIIIYGDQIQKLKELRGKVK